MLFYFSADGSQWYPKPFGYKAILCMTARNPVQIINLAMFNWKYSRCLHYHRYFSHKWSSVIYMKCFICLNLLISLLTSRKVSYEKVHVYCLKFIDYAIKDGIKRSKLVCTQKIYTIYSNIRKLVRGNCNQPALSSRTQPIWIFHYLQNSINRGACCFSGQ